jgi:hypothetical protein
MTPEEERKAEMTLVLMLHDKSRNVRREMCKELGVAWGEYQRLKDKYRRMTERYDLERSKDVLQS